MSGVDKEEVFGLRDVLPVPWPCELREIEVCDLELILRVEVMFGVLWRVPVVSSSESERTSLLGFAFDCW